MQSFTRALRFSYQKRLDCNSYRIDNQTRTRRVHWSAFQLRFEEDGAPSPSVTTTETIPKIWNAFPTSSFRRSGNSDRSSGLSQSGAVAVAIGVPVVAIVVAILAWAISETFQLKKQFKQG